MRAARRRRSCRRGRAPLAELNTSLLSPLPPSNLVSLMLRFPLQSVRAPAILQGYETCSRALARAAPRGLTAPATQARPACFRVGRRCAREGEGHGSRSTARLLALVRPAEPVDQDGVREERVGRAARGPRRDAPRLRPGKVERREANRLERRQGRGRRLFRKCAPSCTGGHKAPAPAEHDERANDDPARRQQHEVDVVRPNVKAERPEARQRPRRPARLKGLRQVVVRAVASPA